MKVGVQSIMLPSGDRVPYSVQQRDVQNPRMTLNPDGTLVVVVPPEISGDDIVATQRDWITAQYKDQQDQLSSILETYGDLIDRFTLWGKSYEIREQTGQYNTSIESDCLIVTTPQGETATSYLKTKIRKALRIAIESLADAFCSPLEGEYSTLSIRSQRTKWASCSNGNTLNFNFRCAFLPVSHLRYLVAHEVVHLVEPHHNKEFWDMVKSLVPSYTTLKSELQGFWYAIHHNPRWQELLG